MGGRGSSSGMKGENVSERVAGWYYNGAKKDTNAFPWDGKIKRDREIEKAIRSGDVSALLKGEPDKKEYERIDSYLMLRQAENNDKIRQLGSGEALFQNQNVAKEHRNILSVILAARDYASEKEFYKAGPTDPTLKYQKSTATYDRWYKRQKENFLAWWNGSGKK